MPRRDAGCTVNGRAIDAVEAAEALDADVQQLPSVGADAAALSPALPPPPPPHACWRSAGESWGGRLHDDAPVAELW